MAELTKGVINKQELKNYWALEPIHFPNFYIYSQGSIDSYLARIPDKFGDELLESEEVGDPPVKQRTVNNPKEEANEAAVLMHLKSGDNSKAQSMEDHLFENLGVSMEKVSRCVKCNQ